MTCGRVRGELTLFDVVMIKSPVSLALINGCGPFRLTGAIALLSLMTLPTQAQITPDGTLGSENSTVTEGAIVQGGLADLIEGGAIRDSNLFHSFLEFNVVEGQRVYFANPAGIQAILSRVTGGNPSNIFGTLGVDGAADLYLLNPSGILFGVNARLDVTGAFVGTTADAIQFGDQGFFGTADLTPPTILTVDPSALWFNQLTPAGITNTSVAPIGVSPSGTPLSGLQAASDRSLLLVGGDINLLTGLIVGSGSRIELGGLAEPGVVGLENDGNLIRLNFPETVARADVTLVNNGLVGLVGGPGGDIVVHADLLAAINGGTLLSITDGVEDGGNITVDAEQILLSGVGTVANNSGFISQVFAGAAGDGGEITVLTDSLTLQEGAQILSKTFGAGDAGNVIIAADTIEMVGGTGNGTLTSSISNSTFSGLAGTTAAVGNAGDVNISTRSLNLLDGAQISTFTVGAGRGGDINVVATESARLIGSTVQANGQSSDSGIRAQSNGSGTAGDIVLETGELVLQAGGAISGSTFESGQGGNVTITANRVEVVGTSASSGFTSGIGSTSDISRADGRSATGAAGDVTISTQRLSIRDGGALLASTSGPADAGNITVMADTVEVVGTSPNQQLSRIISIAGINPITGEPSSGAAGSVTISTRLLNIEAGGLISTSTLGKGQGGNLTIKATEQTELIGATTFANGQFSESALLTATGGSGKAGDIRLETGRLLIQDEANIDASTQSSGNAGGIEIVADSIEMFGQPGRRIRGGIGSQSTLDLATGAAAIGNAGNVTITTRLLSIRDGTQITTDTFGSGKGGNLNVTATEQTELIGSVTLANGQPVPSLLSTAVSGSGEAGNLRLETGRLRIQDGAGINASTIGAGNAGDVEVIADSIEMVGVSGRLFIGGISSQSTFNSQTQKFGTGDAGNVTVSTRSLTISGGSQISTSTLGEGKGGDLSVISTDRTELIGSTRLANDLLSESALITATSGTGEAGSLRLETGQLIIQDEGGINGSTFGAGDAGDVEVIADSIEMSGRPGRAFTGGIGSQSSQNFLTGKFATGNAGDVTVSTRSLTIRDGSQITTDTFGTGQGGNLTVIATETTELIGATILADNRPAVSALSTVTTGAGEAGDLRLETGRLFIQDEGGINASTFGAGSAGDIEVMADSIEILGSQGLLISGGIGSQSSRNFLTGEVASGAAGNVSVSTRSLAIRNAGSISTTTFGAGQGGDLNITVRESAELAGATALANGTSVRSGILTGTLGNGDAGKLTLQVTDHLTVRDGAVISASTASSGAAGNVDVTADTITLLGFSEDFQLLSSIGSTSEPVTPGEIVTGNAGNVNIATRLLSTRVGGRISTETVSQGQGGTLSVTAREATELVGSANLLLGANSSGLTTQTTGAADAGNLRLETGRLTIRDGGSINASTFGPGAAGDVTVIADTIDLTGIRADGFIASTIQSIAGLDLSFSPALGDAGNLNISARRLTIQDGGAISTQTVGPGLAGNITLDVSERVEMRDGGLFTVAPQSAGGDIEINTRQGFESGLLILRGDSNIATQSQRDGGNIVIRGRAIVAFDDSDILTTSEDGRGGDITLGNFFSELSPFNGPPPLDGNNRVDIDATGRIASGTISTPDVSFIENNLNDLSGELVDADTLTAGSCIARYEGSSGSFVVTGSQGLPLQPGNSPAAAYPTDTVQSIPASSTSPTVREPEGVYRLADGRLVLSHECE